MTPAVPDRPGQYRNTSQHKQHPPRDKRTETKVSVRNTMALLKALLLLISTHLCFTYASIVDPSKCVLNLSSEDRFAGTNFTFVLLARDSNGENVNHDDSGKKFAASLVHEDGEEFPQTIEYPSAIAHFVTTNLTKAGPYVMVLEWDGTAIPANGTQLQVNPDVVSEHTSYAFGEGLAGGPAGQTLSFGIQAVDKYGNEHLSGSPGFEVTVVGSLDVHLVSKADNGHGQTLVEVEATEVGEYMFEVKTSTDKLLAISPITIVITEGTAQPAPENDNIVDPEQTTIISARLTNETAGNLGAVYFEARNTAGEFLPLTHADGHFEANVLLPSGELESKQIYATASGYQFFTYRYNVTGTYILLLSWQSTAIPANGTELNVYPSEPSAAMSYPFGEDLGGGLANVPMEFGVQAVDEFGNYLLEGDPKFNVQMSNPSKLQYFNVTSNQEGQTLVQFMANEQNTFQVTVKTQDNVPLASGSFDLVVEEPDSQENSSPTPEPEPEAEAAPVPVPGTEPEPEPESAPVPETEPQPESESAPIPETAPQPEAAPVPETEPQPEPESAPIPETAPQPESESEPESAPMPEIEPQPEPESGLQPGTDEVSAPEQDSDAGDGPPAAPPSPPVGIEETPGQPEEASTPASEADSESSTSSSSGLSKTAVVLIVIGASVAVVVVVIIVLVRNRRRRNSL